MAQVTGSNNYHGSNEGQEEFIQLLELGLKYMKVEINLWISGQGPSTVDARTNQYGKKGEKKKINGKCGLNFIIFRMVTETSPSLQLFSGSEMAFNSVFVYTAPVSFTNK